MGVINMIKRIIAFICGSTLVAQFQMAALMMVAFGYTLVFLAAVEDVKWNYYFNDAVLDNRFGIERFQLIMESKFGSTFRYTTLIVNTMALITVVRPNNRNRYFLLPCLFCNSYIKFSVFLNAIRIIRLMILLKIPLRVIMNIMAGAAMLLPFEVLLTLQIIRFYEYLSYLKHPTNSDRNYIFSDVDVNQLNF